MKKVQEHLILVLILLQLEKIDYMNLLFDQYVITSTTDLQGNILNVSQPFVDISGYSKAELIGCPHNIVRHNDMPKLAFKDLWKTVQKGENWSGFVKNATASGGYYWVYATVYPFESSNGSKGYLSCRRKASDEEIRVHTDLYKQWKSQE